MWNEFVENQFVGSIFQASYLTEKRKALEIKHSIKEEELGQAKKRHVEIPHSFYDDMQVFDKEEVEETESDDNEEQECNSPNE